MTAILLRWFEDVMLEEIKDLCRFWRGTVLRPTGQGEFAGASERSGL
jgi:hypothetical protein